MEGYGYERRMHYAKSSITTKPYHKATSYRDYVDILWSRNPSLLNLHSFLKSPHSSLRTCQITALDFRNGIKNPIQRKLPDIDCLPRELNRVQQPGDEMGRESYEKYHKNPLQGCMLIIEDLTPEVIEILGSKLDIDPLLFALHLHTVQRDGSRSQSPVDAKLPSRLVSQNYMTTPYHRPLECDKKPSGWRFERDMTIDRKLMFIRSTSIGLAQHCVSVVKVQQSEDFWLALLLVDPPIGDTYFPPGHKDKQGSGLHISLRPFLGSHEDFLDAPKFSDSNDWINLDSTPRNGGMASEVLQYFSRYLPPCFDAQNPTLESLAYYPLKIVAAEWAKYIAVMQYCMKMYEYRGDRLPDLDQFNTDLRELQGWRRRSMLSQYKVRSIVRQLKARSSLDASKSQTDISLLTEDFEVICTNIEDAGRRLENMLPVVTSLVQIIDARQSFAETTNISRLTILALIFVPLSFVSSLFSMNDENAPGAKGFWVYFAVAVPITILVVLIARPPMVAVKKGVEWFKGSKRRIFMVPRFTNKPAVEKITEA